MQTFNKSTTNYCWINFNNWSHRQIYQKHRPWITTFIIFLIFYNIHKKYDRNPDLIDTKQTYLFIISDRSEGGLWASQKRILIVKFWFVERSANNRITYINILYTKPANIGIVRHPERSYIIALNNIEHITFYTITP